MADRKERGTGSYRAEQVPGAVILHAEGMTPTPNYTVWLEQSMIDVYPPEYILYWLRPQGMQAQVLTPFHAQTTFRAAERVESVVVYDAEGKHVIPVEFQTL